jgi:hypothetical protein
MSDEAPTAPVSTAPHVFTAVTEVMRAMAVEGVSKARKNEQQGYKFRGIDDVYNALSAHMARVGLIIVPDYSDRTEVERKSNKGFPLFYVTIKGKFSLHSSVDGSMFPHTVSTYGEAMDSADKATNKAMSAAFKYAAMQLFCIPTEGDNDADFTTHVVMPNGETVANEASVASKPAKESRALFSKLQAEVRKVVEVSGLTDLWMANKEEIGSNKWKQEIIDMFAARRSEIEAAQTVEADEYGEAA